VAGVLGVLPGIIGAIQGLEVIKVAAAIGEPLSGRMFVLDTLSFESRILNIKKSPENKVRTSRASEIEMIDYEAYCGSGDSGHVKQMQPETIVIDDVWLLDVRTGIEVARDSIGGVHIPKAEVETNLLQIPRDKTVVVYCETGVRSSQVIELLSDKYGFNNLFNLEGGIVNYRRFFPK
jgi:adenylyltransferase/sulfurtransferase